MVTFALLVWISLILIAGAGRRRDVTEKDGEIEEKIDRMCEENGGFELSDTRGCIRVRIEATRRRPPDGVPAR